MSGFSRNSLNRFGLAAASAAAALVIASGASAEGPVKERVFGNPPVLGQPSAATGAASLLRLPAPGPRVSNERSYNLDIKYVESRLFDPSTGHDQKVRLRGYVGTDTDPERPYIAPDDRGGAGRYGSGHAEQQAAGRSKLHRTRSGDRYSALLQRHQPALAWSVGQPDRQQRQRAAEAAAQQQLPVRIQHPVGSSLGHLLVSPAPPRLDGVAGGGRHGRRADRARRPQADTGRER